MSLGFQQGIAIVFPLLIFPYLLRVLGISGFGVFSLMQTGIMYFDLLIAFGFGLTATQRIANAINDIDLQKKIIAAVQSIKLFLFAATSARAGTRSWTNVMAQPVLHGTFSLTGSGTFQFETDGLQPSSVACPETADTRLVVKDPSGVQFAAFVTRLFRTCCINPKSSLLRDLRINRTRFFYNLPQ